MERYLSAQELQHRLGVSGWASPTYVTPTDPNPEWTPYRARGLGSQHGIVTRMLRTDGLCRGIVTSVTEALRSGTLRVEPPPDPTAIELDLTDWCEYCLNEQEGGVAGWLESVSLYLAYGFWTQEICLELRQTPWGLRYALRALEDRPPWTVWQWIEDSETERLVALVQRDRGGREATIPATKLLVYTHARAEGGREGVSILRPAYFSWQLKQEILRADAGAWERWGYGTPEVRQTAKTVPTSATDDLATALHSYHTHQNDYIIYPYGYDGKISFPAHTAPDPSGRVNMLNREMAVAADALWMLHGSSETGPRATTGEQLSFFRAILQHRADSLCRVLDTPTRDGPGLLPLLVRANYSTLPAGTRTPSCRMTGLRERDMEQLAALLRNLVEGRVVTPDPALERWTREEVGLPERGADD